MDKVRIQEIAAEAGMSSKDLLVKAKELNYGVKVATSSISMEQASTLMNYAISGVLPKSHMKKESKKADSKEVASENTETEDVKLEKVSESKKEVEEKVVEKTDESTDGKEVTNNEESVKKKTPIKEKGVLKSLKPKGIRIVEKAKDNEPIETKEANIAEVPVAKESKEEIQKPAAVVEKSKEPIEVDRKDTVKDVPSEQSAVEPVTSNDEKEVKKPAPISTPSMQITPKVKPEDAEKKQEEAPKPKPKRSLGRRGITIVKKAKPAPTRQSKKISLSGSGGGVPTPPKKKKPKRIVEARDTGSRMEIMNDRGLNTSVELYEEEEVVLLDFSDKNIYEEMKRQEQKRKEEAKKNAKRVGPNNQYRPQGRRSIKRGGKKKKYIREESEEKVSVISIPEDVRVYEFAEKVGKNVGEVVKVLFTLGTMVTKNDFLDKDSIEILAEEFEVEVKTINPLDALDYVEAYDAKITEGGEHRAPVVTIMGHVDHGKTSLLDKIRETKVAHGEAGGITQHVGAYQIERDGKRVTFIDTPGHSAFTEMRARGAKATDIAIIVVAADDGVMPQTKESISHAKAAGVPVIIAINKMDKEAANPDNVKSQLAEIGVLSVDWGGEYEFVPVSAHSGMGIEDLVETILLQAEVMELEADPARNAKATIIESSLEKGLGAVANVIINDGTLKVGDNVIAGTTFGRIKTLILDDGSRAKSIGPSVPAAVVGLQEVPKAGEVLVVMENEKEARDLANKRKEYSRTKELSKSTKVSIDELGSLIAEGQVEKLNLIVKTDVQGSLEAIKGALVELRNEEVKVDVIHDGVGGISENDVALADASENCFIVGFNVRPTGAVKNKAKDLDIDIKSYSVIYDIIDDVKALLGGLMSPVVSEEVTGQAEVRETFTVAKVGTIAGCKVSDGVITRNANARLIRDGVVVYTSTISSLKRFNDDAREVKNGFECGIMLANYNDIKDGDVIETFKEVEEQATL